MYFIKNFQCFTQHEANSMILAVLLFLRVATSAYFSQFTMREPDKDPCYESTGKPVRCVPEFINAAFGKPVIASNTCGMDGPSRFCTISVGNDGTVRETCDVCDASKPQHSHPASLITDFNAPGNMTCWISEPSLKPENVSLTLSLGKKFELTYISMYFCSRLPDSMALFKSTDHGKTWIPFQYYSSDCLSMFGRSPDVAITKHNEQEALCTNSHTVAPITNRVAFPFLENRPSAIFFESSPVLQDWVTATDIRILFTRLGSDQKNLFGALNDVNGESNSSTDNSAKDFFYAMGELAVGGRCKCNGHASRCIFDKMGKFICDCKHNTAGTECETCKPFHFDRPWGRATSQTANACVACNCNMHAKRCRFDQELYRLSENRSGGVCMNCRHNTIGRNCHLCKTGYFRDANKPITNKKACKHCGCHPVGSLSKSCNQMSGQCVCKVGVIGLACNRCAKGYQQSRSTVTPCIRIPVKESSGGKGYLEKGGCRKCRVFPKKMNQKKYCKRDYVFQMFVTGKEVVGSWARYNVVIENVFKRGVQEYRGILFELDQFLDSEFPGRAKSAIDHKI
nr:Laminin and EGF and Netrin module domain containing protein [Haemonchus contortus]